MQILDSGEEIGLKHFRPIRPLGSGDTGWLVCFASWIFTLGFEVVVYGVWGMLIEIPHSWNFTIFWKYWMSVCIWYNCVELISTSPWRLWIRVSCSIGTRYRKVRNWFYSPYFQISVPVWMKCSTSISIYRTPFIHFLQVHRACAEREILDMLDHPFLPALYASFQVRNSNINPYEKS